MNTLSENKLFGSIIILLIVVGMSVAIAPIIITDVTATYPSEEPDGNAYYSTLMATQTYTKLICPRFEQTAAWDTEIRIFNPNLNTASVTIKFYDESGDLLDSSQVYISSYNTLSFRPRDYDVTESSGSIFITSDLGIVGDIIRYHEFSAASEPLQPGNSQSPEGQLYCPYFKQNGGWDSWIAISFHSDVSSTADLNFFYNKLDGTHETTKNYQLNNHQTLYMRPIDMNVNLNEGNINIDSSISNGGAVTGYTIRTDGDSSYSEPLMRETVSSATTFYEIVSKNNNDLTTILYINNPTSSSIDVDFDYYDTNGSILDNDSQTLNINETVSIDVSNNQDIPVGIIGSIQIKTTSGSFVGFSAEMLDSGAAWSTPIIITSASTLYASNIIDSAVFGSWHTTPWIFNTNTQSSSELDVEFRDSDGTIQTGLQDIPIGIISIETPRPNMVDEVDSIDGSLIVIDGQVVGKIIAAVGSTTCDNCPEIQCDPEGDNGCTCNHEDGHCTGAPSLCINDGCQRNGCSCGKNCDNNNLKQGWECRGSSNAYCTEMGCKADHCDCGEVCGTSTVPCSSSKYTCATQSPGCEARGCLESENDCGTMCSVNPEDDTENCYVTVLGGHKKGCGYPRTTTEPCGFTGCTTNGCSEGNNQICKAENCKDNQKDCNGAGCPRPSCKNSFLGNNICLKSDDCPKADGGVCGNTVCNT